jgi:excisionase family DNA binding protein
MKDFKKEIVHDLGSATIIYNTKELASLLSVSTRTIQRWRDSGTVKFSAIGKKYYYNHVHIMEMITNNLNNTSNGSK